MRAGRMEDQHRPDADKHALLFLMCNWKPKSTGPVSESSLTSVPEQLQWTTRGVTDRPTSRCVCPLRAPSLLVVQVQQRSGGDWPHKDW